MNSKKTLFILLMVSFFSKLDSFYFDTDKPDEVAAGSKIKRCVDCCCCSFFVMNVKQSSSFSVAVCGCAFDNHGFALPCCGLVNRVADKAQCQICCKTFRFCFSNSKSVSCCCCFEAPINCCCIKRSSIKDIER